MLTKENLIECKQAMPEERFDDMDVLLERMVMLEKIERGLNDIENGNVYKHEEVGEIINTWFRK